MTEPTLTAPTIKTPPKPKKPGTKLATTLSLAALLIAGGSAYYNHMQQQQGLQNLQATNQDHSAQIQTQFSQLQDDLALTTQQVITQKTQIQQLSSSLTRNHPNGLLAEVNYLVHIANFNLLYQHNPQMALALLKAADQTLMKLSDPALNNVHQAFLSDINQLAALPAINKEAILNQLNALSVALTLLPVANVDANTTTLATTPTATASTSWWQRAWQNTLSKLGSFIKVRQIGSETSPILNHVAQAYAKQDLQILLTQAQLAAMQPNNVLYQLSLKQAQNVMEQYFDLKVALVSQFLTALQQLEMINVSPNLPSLTASLTALQQATPTATTATTAPTVNNPPAASPTTPVRPNTGTAL